MDVNHARTFLVILLTCLFCAPAASASTSGPHEGAAHARGTYIQQDPFDMEFDNVTCSNSSFSLSLPTNSTIYSASVDLVGEPVVAPPSSADCDFSGDGTDFVAYTGTGFCTYTTLYISSSIYTS